MAARDDAFTAMQSANKNDPGEVASATSYFNSANKDVTNANKEWADAIKQRMPYIKKLKGLEGAKSVMNANCVFIRTSIAKASKLVSSVKTKEDAEKLSDAFNNYIDMIETFLKDLNDATAMFKEIDTSSKALIKRDKIENLKRATAEVAIYKKQLDALKAAAKKRGF